MRPGMLDDKTVAALESLNEIFKNKYELFLVGGCVRDMYMNTIPHDFDFATNATPDEMEQLATANGISASYVGRRFGTVVFHIQGHDFEITTYRTEGDYRDGRRPSILTFADNLLDDLSRRDLTINAMALQLSLFLTLVDSSDYIIDPYDGKEDIRLKVIRSVGSPVSRIKEDGLRILRAIRFAVKFSFQIESTLLNAIYENIDMLDNVAMERKRSEFSQILVYWNRQPYEPFGLHSKEFAYYYRIICFIVKVIIPEMQELSTFVHNNPYHLYDIFTHSMLVCYNCTGDSETILAALLHDIGKMKCVTKDEKLFTNHFYGHAAESETLARTILMRMKYSSKEISEITQLIKYHDVRITPTYAATKRLLNKLGELQLHRLLYLKTADAFQHIGMDMTTLRNTYSIVEEFCRKIIEQQEAFSLADLAINGTDLMNLGIPEGPMIGRTLDDILEVVMSNDVENTRESIIRYLVIRGIPKE